MTVEMTMEEYKDLERAQNKLAAAEAGARELNNKEGVAVSDIYNFFMKYFNVSLRFKGYI